MVITIKTKPYNQVKWIVALVLAIVLFSPMYGRAETYKNNENIVEISGENIKKSIIVPNQVIIAVQTASEKFNIPAQYILAMLCVENGKFDPNLIHYNNNGTHDIGYAQINSSNLSDFAASGFKDVYNIDDNIQYGTLKLKYAQNVYGDDWHKIYMVYNMGGQKAKVFFANGTTQTKYSQKAINIALDIGKYFDEQSKKESLSKELQYPLFHDCASSSKILDKKKILQIYLNQLKIQGGEYHESSII